MTRSLEKKDIVLPNVHILYETFCVIYISWVKFPLSHVYGFIIFNLSSKYVQYSLHK